MIIGPILIAIFIQIFLLHSFNRIPIIIIYTILLLIVINQLFALFKYRQLFYNDTTLTIKKYFNNESIEIPINSVNSIDKKFSLSKEYTQMSYKLTYKSEGKKFTVYFYKAVNLYNVDDIASYIGVENKV